METAFDIPTAIDTLEHATGIAIPVYFRAGTALEWGATLLRATVQMFAREVANPQAICLSADGGGVSRQIAESVAAEYGVQVVGAEHNRGKLANVRNSMMQLLENPDLRYLAVVDCDGDHFANELLTFVRCAEQIRRTVDAAGVLVLGSRLSGHRPLGFLRAEQETLANELLVEALRYHAAVTGKPLVWQFVSPLELLPDFHSGYKLFSCTIARHVFLSTPNFASCQADAYFRHACEAVMVVEALQAGALLATVNRRTFDEQPTSSFAQFDRAQLAADMIIWPCKRLQIPGPFVAQWLTNHLPRLLLGTLVPQGRAELATIRQLVLTAFEQPLPVDSQEIVRPMFV